MEPHRDHISDHTSPFSIPSWKDLIKLDELLLESHYTIIYEKKLKRKENRQCDRDIWRPPIEEGEEEHYQYDLPSNGQILRPP